MGNRYEVKYIPINEPKDYSKVESTLNDLDRRRYAINEIYNRDTYVVIYAEYMEEEQEMLEKDFYE